jgi:hypothetical protein
MRGSLPNSPHTASRCPRARQSWGRGAKLRARARPHLVAGEPVGGGHYVEVAAELGVHAARAGIPLNVTQRRAVAQRAARKRVAGLGGRRGAGGGGRRRGSAVREGASRGV